MQKKNNQQPLISVIVPIYNVEGYLARCLDSLLSQTYEMFELLLIDDGSTDASASIADTYATTDQRIKVIHKENGGLSDARNVGLINAVGEYVAFVDSDDYVDPYYLEYLYGAIKRETADIAVCDFIRVHETDVPSTTFANSKEYITTNFTSDEAVSDVIFSSSTLSIVTWNKLYKKSIFVDLAIEFPVGKLHEDNFTTYKLVAGAKKVTHIAAPLYYYTYRSDSIIGSGFSPRSFDKFEAVEALKAWAETSHLSLVKSIEAYGLSVGLDVLNAIVESEAVDTIYWRRARTFALQAGTSVLRNSLIPTKQKVAYAFLSMGRPAYTFLRAIYKRDLRLVQRLLAKTVGVNHG